MQFLTDLFCYEYVPTIPLNYVVLKGEFKVPFACVPTSGAHHLYWPQTILTFSPSYSPSLEAKDMKLGNRHFWFHGTELREGLRTVWREVGSNVWSTHTGKNWPSLQPAQMWEAKAGWVPCAPPAPLLPAAVVPFPCLGNPGPGANLNLESEVRRVPEPELAVSLCKIASLSTYYKLRNYLTSPPSAHHIWNPTTRQLMPVRLAMPRLRQWMHWMLGKSTSGNLGFLICTVEIILSTSASIWGVGKKVKNNDEQESPFVNSEAL